MPTYDTISAVPQSKAVDTWKAFCARLAAAPELGWLGGRVLRHDIPALRSEDSPTLCVVKVSDNWQRTAIGRKPPYNATYGFGMRLYLYDGGGTVEQTEALYDTIENLNEVIVRVLRSEYMACYEPFWKEFFLEEGQGGGRTSVIGKVKERLFITTRFSILRHFRPGQ